MSERMLFIENAVVWDDIL